MDGRLARSDRGFTLIELMIAVAVMASLATAVTLSVARPSGDAQTDLRRFTEMHDRLRTEAAISRQLLAVAVDATGYQRLAWDGTAWQQVGPAMTWSGPVAVRVPFRSDTPIEFAPSGQVTPFQLQFESRLCESDGWGPVACSAR
jgi:type II secretion system protein H